MMKVFDKPFKFQKLNEDTEVWEDVLKTLHASINRGRADSETIGNSGTENKRTLIFEMRYFKDLEQVANNTEIYRIVYNDVNYNITDFDDYMLEHRTAKITGVSY